MITVQKQDGVYLLRPESEPPVEASLFDPDWLAEQGLLLEELMAGRGSVYFFQRGNYELVLKQFFRGGLAAKISGSHYFWSGVKHSRPWRELELLERLDQLKLPAPKPAAAMIRKQGIRYQAWLITYRLIESTSLAARLRQAALPDALWQAIGGTIRQFHDAGIFHADLNANNILINSDQRIFLIDFDKGRERTHGNDRWKFDNLSRLQRSLEKQAEHSSQFNFSKKAWSLLTQGYSSRFSFSAV